MISGRGWYMLKGYVVLDNWRMGSTVRQRL
jgi:hypothetical protein